jgi:hypothetical protein
MRVALPSATEQYRGIRRDNSAVNILLLQDQLLPNEESSLLGYSVVSQMFRRGVVPPSSGSSSPRTVLAISPSKRR